MQNCYSNRAYMHGYYSFVCDFFFSLFSLTLPDTLSPTLQCQKEEEVEEVEVEADHQHPSIITTNQPPPPPPQPTHYNINLIQKQSTQI